MRPFAPLAVVAALICSLPAAAQQAASAPAATPAIPAPGAAPAPAVTDVTQTVVVVQATPKPVEEKWGRELNGHFFLPSHLIDDPFSYTAFGMTFGLGSGQALGPTVQLQPPEILPGTKWYGYTGLGVGFLMNVRFLEYLSARAAIATSAYLGTGNGAVLTVGTAARITADVGVKGSLPVGKYFRFSASFDVAYGPVYNILIAQPLAEAIRACQADPQNCKISMGDFLQQQDTVTYTGGLGGAWAPLSYLGFIVNASFIAPTKTGKASTSQNGYTLAGMVDFDLKPLVRWLPIGFNGVYSVTSPVGSSGVTTTQEFGGGIYYTGSRDLALGVELDWRLGRLESTQVQELTAAWINMRYYWN